MEILLLYIVFLPFLSGILFLFFRSRLAKYSALFISIIELILTVMLFSTFRSESFQVLSATTPWITTWGIDLELGLDGINVLFVLLTGISIPVILLAGWNKHYHNYGLMDGMVLILQGSLMGVYLSFNAFVYYIFWELTLVPAYLILLLWGGDRRMQITLKFFIYTLAGSLFMLVALISLFLLTPGNHSFSFQSLSSLTISPNHQFWLFLAFVVAFFIKTPIFPFHSWQPDTYTQSPSAGTMLLGGLMSKMGIFSMLRWLFPVLENAVREYGPFIIGLAVVSLLYTTIIAMQQKNIKSLFAYSSIAHLSLAVAAIFTLRNLAIQGALLFIFSHGIVIIALFFVADIFKSHSGSLWLNTMGGFRIKTPVFAGIYLVILLASIGLPLMSGFPGEFLIIAGLLDYNIWLAAFAGLSIILGAVYMLSSYRRTMHGELAENDMYDLNAREKFVFGILICLIFFVGLVPSVLLKCTESSVELLVNFLRST